jgi:CubicO group peptidase (beta-lactamase class C family)
MSEDTRPRQIAPAIEIELEHLLAAVNVPGLALAVVRAGQLEPPICCGIRDVRSPFQVDKDTVFDAASLSKPVFAHSVLQLIDDGVLSLDVPLAQYLPGYIHGDERAASITAAHVLSHSSGLPNWRGDDLPLKTYFAPGTRFSYSGEGFLYLQKAIEALTGEKLHEIADRLVFKPFGMTRSSFVWDWRFDPNRATPHDDFGRPRVSWKPGEGNAAATLQTTVADYARFLVNVFNGSRLRPDTSNSWLRSYLEVRHTKYVSLEPVAEDHPTGVAWGLGWGLEPNEGTFFHWGDNGAYKAFTVGSVRTHDALVCFMNGASGLALMPEIASNLMPGPRPSLDWLGYGRHDDPARRILRAAQIRGAAAVWSDIASLGESDREWVARGLIAAGLDEDALWLQERIKQSDGDPPPKPR